MRETLAVRLLEQEQDRYDRIVKLSELLARLAPMFGLLGTLIPLGPGIIALGQGDTQTLSTSLLTAFDTTIAGLCAAAVCLVVTTLRKRWYGSIFVSMVPSGLRTAQQMFFGPRIMMPSIRACPPTLVLKRSCFG